MGRESDSSNLSSFFSSRFSTGTEMSKWIPRIYDTQTIVANVTP